MTPNYYDRLHHYTALERPQSHQGRLLSELSGTHWQATDNLRGGHPDHCRICNLIHRYGRTERSIRSRKVKRILRRCRCCKHPLRYRMRWICTNIHRSRQSLEVAGISFDLIIIRIWQGTSAEQTQAFVQSASHPLSKHEDTPDVRIASVHQSHRSSDTDALELQVVLARGDAVGWRTKDADAALRELRNEDLV